MKYVFNYQKLGKFTGFTNDEEKPLKEKTESHFEQLFIPSEKF